MSKKRDEIRVVEYDRPGDTGVLEMRTVTLPPPETGEVTVEVLTSGINHIDGFIRSGQEQTWADEPWPRRSGSDFAGIIVASGEQKRGFTRGTEVIGHVRSGAHATALNVPVSALIRRPNGVSWETAGGLYLAGGTALDTLDSLSIGAGDILVISAAAGGVGSIEAQLAKHRGATVIGTCGARNFDYLRQLGIKPVQYGEGIAERIRKVAGGQVTAMIDNFGQDGRQLADDLDMPATRYRSSDDRRDTELRLLRDDAESVAHGTDLLERLAQLARVRAFTLLVSGFYPFADIAEAYNDLSKYHARGKIVLGTRPVSAVPTLKARDIHEAGR